MSSTPKWSLSVVDHPVRIDNAWPWNRWRLLEMGHVLATVRCGRVRDRLRDPNGYLGIQAELRAGALLGGLGAALSHEPRSPRAKVQGQKGGLRPDWRAEWPDGSVHVEVKLSHTSAQANAREVWASLFSGEGPGRGRPRGGARRRRALGQRSAQTKGSLMALAGASTTAIVCRGVARQAATSLAALLRVRRPLGPVRGRFTLALGCEVTLKARTDGGSGLSFDGRVFVSDEHRITLRLTTHLKEAAEQLDDMPGGRVVLLDASHDSALRRPTRCVRDLLAEPWAARVAAVMIVYRHYPHCTVEVVRGWALDADPVSRLIRAKLRRCNRRHHHAEVLATIKAPDLSCCDAWGVSQLPAARNVHKLPPQISLGLPGHPPACRSCPSPMDDDSLRNIASRFHGGPSATALLCPETLAGACRSSASFRKNHVWQFLCGA